MKRVALGKTIGLIFGLVWLIYTAYYTSISLEFGVGVLFLYIITGALIGMIGVMNKHPLFGFKMPWWLRGSLMWGFMFLLLPLLGYNTMVNIMTEMGSNMSPYWAILDGIVFWATTDYLATKWYWEGKKIVK